MTILPPELWLRILHLAAQPDVDARADEHLPFQPTPTQRLGAHVALVARLVRVCRAWHNWLLPTLYENVELGKGTISLPQHVRRVVLPYTSTTYDSHPNPAAVVEDLHQCAQVEVLCRPPAGVLVGKSFTGPPPVSLPSLQRLEWCLIEDTDDPVQGGINSLVGFALACPNLRYLSLLLDGPASVCPNEQRIASMSKLETLRLSTRASWIVRSLSQYLVFPVLKTLILDHATVYGFITPFMMDVGRTVTRLELGDDTPFDIPSWLFNILHDFPVLQDLGYHFCVMKAPSPPPTHNRLRRIRLHPGKPAHRIRDDLYFHGQGEWPPFMQDPQWQIVVESITAQGRDVALGWEESR